jgi:hypothetical protein
MRKHLSLLLLRVERMPTLALELLPGALLVAGGLLVTCIAVA